MQRSASRSLRVTVALQGKEFARRVLRLTPQGLAIRRQVLTEGASARRRITQRRDEDANRRGQDFKRREHPVRSLTYRRVTPNFLLGAGRETRLASLAEMR